MRLSAQWTSVVHRAFVALAFGLLILVSPDRSLPWFAPLILFYAMADGVLAIAAAARAAYAREPWAWLLVEGFTGLSGILVIAVRPQANIPVLAWSVTGWAVVTAIGALTAAASLGERATRGWLLASAAVVWLRFTVLAIGALRAGESVIAFSSAAGALAFTALLLGRVFGLRRWFPGAARATQLFARGA
jgi:uncharacterized membrane protein HdeD (DUF308 family)